MTGIKQVRNKKLLPDLRKEGELTKEIVLSTKEKHGVPAGSRLFSHHTLASVRKLSFYHQFFLPQDSLDIVLAATYNHSTERFADKEDLYLQPETIGCETWRRLRNTFDKYPPVAIPLLSKGSDWKIDHMQAFCLVKTFIASDLDHDTTNKKCHRVRSWYLYEQYKSLEKNQSDAARKLKNKSYQDKILRQEMKERRARRRLCDNFGSCQSESKIDKARHSPPPRTPLSVNADDLYESFCELHDDHLYGFDDNISCDSSHTSKYNEEFTSVDDKREESDNESVHSVVKNVTFENNLADDVKEELEIVKKNIAENINLQLETVKENIECLEKFTKLGDADDLPENESSDLFEQCESSQVCTVKEDKKFCPKNDKEFFPLWAKLVAFAYESVHLNHGNFYNSSSSQLMLAVLFCDMLRRGINKMCHILQPYLSPIKYATSDSDISDESYKSSRRKSSGCLNKCLSVRYKMTPMCDNSKHRSCKKIRSCQKLRWLDSGYQSEYKEQHHSKHSFDNRFNEMKYASEPWPSVSKLLDTQKSSEKSSCSIWPQEFSKAKLSDKSVCKCRCLRNVVTPILQLARYIESVLQDIED